VHLLGWELTSSARATASIIRELADRRCGESPIIAPADRAKLRDTDAGDADAQRIAELIETYADLGLGMA